MTILDNHIQNPHPTVATIGFFDGVHLGHRHLISQVISEAKARGMSSAVVTFAQHPLKVIRPGWIPQLLTTTEEKKELLSSTGIDSVALLHFDHEMQMMSAEDFMRNVLLNIYNVRVLIIGYDHHFGHDRSEGFADYVRYGKKMGIEVIQCQQFTASIDPSHTASIDSSQTANIDSLTTSLTPSSTLARQSLLSGDIATATSVLGYPFFLQGTVVEGFQNGRKMGFPTANLSVDEEKIIPGNGVYLVRVGTHYGMLNIGTRPTLDNGSSRSIEVHIFDFEGDLYNRPLRIELLRFIRKERKFDNLAQLQMQLTEDERQCRNLIP